jgi:hypothetical protein
MPLHIHPCAIQADIVMSVFVAPLPALPAGAFLLKSLAEFPKFQANTPDNMFFPASATFAVNYGGTAIRRP